MTVGGRLAAIAALGTRIDEVGAQVRDQILAHPIRGTARERLLKRGSAQRGSFQPCRARSPPRSALRCEEARA